MFEKIKKTIDRGVATAGVQSSTYLESTKLRAMIENVQNSVQQAKTEMGNTVYANWKNGNENTAYIESVCTNIRRMEEEIDGYKAQIEVLQAEKGRVLNAAAAASSSVSGIVCSCGQVNNPNAKFCRGCGKPMEAPVQTAHVCVNCGAQLEEEALFCTNCGTKQS